VRLVSVLYCIATLTGLVSYVCYIDMVWYGSRQIMPFFSCIVLVAFACVCAWALARYAEMDE
jgi:hypothetical protein